MKIEQVYICTNEVISFYEKKEVILTETEELKVKEMIIEGLDFEQVVEQIGK